MLFVNSISIPIQTNIRRKEYDSFLVNKHMSNTSIIQSKRNNRVSPRPCLQRASLCTSGSITVEAALAIPLFFFALLAIIYLMEMTAVQMHIRIGMHSALDEIVSETTQITYMTSTTMEDIIIEAIGEEWLDKSMVINGSEGIDCSQSSISSVTGLITLRVSYGVTLPIPQFTSLGMYYEEEMVAKGWTGYTSNVSISEEEMVYITDTSSVYHVSASCTHLVLDISSASASNLEDLRNEYGGTYSACSKCIDETNDVGELSNVGGQVYIASTGSHYHSTLSCSGLTRTVYTIPISEAIGMGVCSRCGNY